MVAVEHQIQQVFLKLFLNARDAMPRGGWLAITTRLEGGRAVAEITESEYFQSLAQRSKEIRARRPPKLSA